MRVQLFYGRDAVGITTSYIYAGTVGEIVVAGALKNVDTTGALDAYAPSEIWALNEVIYADNNYLSKMTKINDILRDRIGYVKKIGTTDGILFVDIKPKDRLTKLEDFQPTTGFSDSNSILTYNTSTRITTNTRYENIIKMVHIHGPVRSDWGYQDSQYLPMAYATVIIINPYSNCPVYCGYGVPAAGQTRYLIIKTISTTSVTISFASPFITQGNFVSGTVNNKTFVISFVSDGTNLIETSRTGAMV
jgi:hypothetical protein